MEINLKDVDSPDQLQQILTFLVQLIGEDYQVEIDKEKKVIRIKKVDSEGRELIQE